MSAKTTRSEVVSLRVVRCQALPSAFAKPDLHWGVFGFPLEAEDEETEEAGEPLGPSMIIIGELFAHTENELVAVTAEAVAQLPKGFPAGLLSDDEDQFIAAFRPLAHTYKHALYDTAADFARGLIASLRMEIPLPFPTPEPEPITRWRAPELAHDEEPTPHTD